MKKIMKEKNHAVPDEVLSKKFLNQFKTEADVSKFPEIDLAALGFPVGWEQEPLWIQANN